MPPRRSHRKSRNGCFSCKRRRVKCDESGPPCGPCQSREIDCSYPDPEVKGESSSRESRSETRSETISETIDPPSSGESRERRLLEVELMHHWSTVTYKCMVCGGEDWEPGSWQEVETENWQILVPIQSLSYEFLLRAMLALASLEIFVFRQDYSYLATALEYQNAAFHAFRTEISGVTSENCEAAFAFSLITMILSMALPHCLADGTPDDMVDSMLRHFEMLKGTGLVTVTSWEWLKTSPLTRSSRARRWEDVERSAVDDDTLRAIERLNAINEAAYEFACAQNPDSKLQSMSRHAACRKAIFLLEECFAKCQGRFERGYSLAWLNLCGLDYVSAIRDRYPVALLILMHWGVLADRVSHDIWWARSSGRGLVEEISAVLLPDASSQMETSVVWARRQVGL